MICLASVLTKLLEVMADGGFNPASHQAVRRLRRELAAMATKAVDEATFLSKGAAVGKILQSLLAEGLEDPTRNEAEVLQARAAELANLK